MKLLLVEDNELLRKLTLRLIESLGHEADGVGDGEAAVRVATSGRYDVVLMDLNLPLLSGLEAARRITALHAVRTDGLGRPMLIALTAERAAGNAQTWQEAGFSDWIAKPVEPEALERVLESRSSLVDSEATEVGDEQPVAPGPDDSPVDLVRLRVMAEGSDPQARKLAGLFLQQINAKFPELESAVCRQDWPEVRKVAHFCSGSSFTFGMLALAFPMKALEVAARDGRTMSAPSLFEDCRSGLERTRAFLERFITPSLP